jgi:hypothetical protein
MYNIEIDEEMRSLEVSLQTRTIDIFEIVNRQVKIESSRVQILFLKKQCSTCLATCYLSIVNASMASLHRKNCNKLICYGRKPLCISSAINLEACRLA